MPDREIYAQAVPEDAQTSFRDTSSSEVSTDYALSGGGAPTKQLGPNPNSIRVQATLRGRGAEHMAKEIGELFSSGDIEFVPYFGTDVPTDEDGYYATDEDREDPVDPRQRADLYEVDARLERIGSRETHLRRVSTSVTTVDNDLGNGDERLLAVDDRVREPEWFDRVTGEVTAAEPVSSREGDWGDYDVYDATDSPFDRAELVFDLEYKHQPKGDVSVWDSKGNDDKVDSDGNVQWRKVYSTRYAPDNAFVLESGVLRLEVGDGTLSAERWDGSDYSGVSLEDSDWEPSVVDVSRIGTARLDATVRFRNTDTDERYALNATLTRGDEDVLWYRTQNASEPTPEGLIDLLDPIAQTARFRTGENDDLVSADKMER